VLYDVVPLFQALGADKRIKNIMVDQIDIELNGDNTRGATFIKGSFVKYSAFEKLAETAQPCSLDEAGGKSFIPCEIDAEGLKEEFINLVMK
jgi:hypothetical protein